MMPGICVRGIREEDVPPSACFFVTTVTIFVCVALGLNTAPYIHLTSNGSSLSCCLFFSSHVLAKLIKLDEEKECLA